MGTGNGSLDMGYDDVITDGGNQSSRGCFRAHFQSSCLASSDVVSRVFAPRPVSPIPTAAAQIQRLENMVFETIDPVKFYGGSIPRPFLMLQKNNSDQGVELLEGRRALGLAEEGGRLGGVLRNNEVLLGAYCNILPSCW